MAEMCLTATDFRHHLTRITELVSYQEHRVVMMRHGRDMVALVSWEDLEFLRKHRPLKERKVEAIEDGVAAHVHDGLIGREHLPGWPRRVRPVPTHEERLEARRKARAEARAEWEAEMQRREDEQLKLLEQQYFIRLNPPRFLKLEEVERLYPEFYGIPGWDAETWVRQAYGILEKHGRAAGLSPPPDQPPASA
jgi:hypothetical protein